MQTKAAEQRHQWIENLRKEAPSSFLYCSALQTNYSNVI